MRKLVDPDLSPLEEEISLAGVFPCCGSKQVGHPRIIVALVALDVAVAVVGVGVRVKVVLGGGVVVVVNVVVADAVVVAVAFVVVAVAAVVVLVAAVVVAVAVAVAVVVAAVVAVAVVVAAVAVVLHVVDITFSALASSAPLLPHKYARQQFFHEGAASASLAFYLVVRLCCLHAHLMFSISMALHSILVPNISSPSVRHIVILVVVILELHDFGNMICFCNDGLIALLSNDSVSRWPGRVRRG